MRWAGELLQEGQEIRRKTLLVLPPDLLALLLSSPAFESPIRD
jgi:hypothetical protein